MKLLAIDPGGMNGLAWYNDDYTLEGFTQVKLADLPSWLEDHSPAPDLIVYENFKLWKHRALQQSGSDLPAAQGIGIIKSYASRHKIQTVNQSPQILTSAEKMCQMKMPSDHSQSHWVSAHLHAQWYFIKNGLKLVEMALEDR